MAYDFFDTDPDLVDSCGRATAATASDWRGWANKAEGCLRDGPATVRDPVIAAAWEGFAGDTIQASHRLAQQVDDLGRRTSGAASHVAEADVAAVHELSSVAGLAADLRTRLSGLPHTE